MTGKFDPQNAEYCSGYCSKVEGYHKITRAAKSLVAYFYLYLKEFINLRRTSLKEDPVSKH
jgi:hypothetical protein